ncbi:twin-arginine translocation signal domain-containing protein, partial [Sunxiuqinia elliptica]
MKNISRRKFVKATALAGAAFSVVPSTVMGKSFGHTAPSDKLNIAGVGVGGMGRNNLRNMSAEN